MKNKIKNDNFFKEKIRYITKTFFSTTLIILVALMFRSFIAEPFRIPSGSMKNGLLIGDYIFVFKGKYGYSKHSLPFSLPIIKGRVFYKSPKRGDVVVFRPPNQIKLHYIKRIIGLPNDVIQIINGNLYINGNRIEKKEIGEWTDPDNKKKLKQFTESIANKKYNILLEEKTEKYKYTNNTNAFKVPKDHFFVLGDNRNHSLDSRFSEIGFIPKDNLIGEAKLIVFSFNKQNKFFLKFDRFMKKIK